jgi:hypothetical protein
LIFSASPLSSRARTVTSVPEFLMLFLIIMCWWL